MSHHSQNKRVSWSDVYFICRLVVLETKFSASWAAVISEVKASNKDSVDRI